MNLQHLNRSFFHFLLPFSFSLSTHIHLHFLIFIPPSFHPSSHAYHTKLERASLFFASSFHFFWLYALILLFPLAFALICIYRAFLYLTVNSFTFCNYLVTSNHLYKTLAMNNRSFVKLRSMIYDLAISLKLPHSEEIVRCALNVHHCAER